MVRRQLPEWLHTAPQMPALVREWLQQGVNGSAELAAAQLLVKQQQELARRQQRLLAGSLLGFCLLITAALLFIAGHTSDWPWAFGLAGLISFAWGWPRPRGPGQG